MMYLVEIKPKNSSHLSSLRRQLSYNRLIIVVVLLQNSFVTIPIRMWFSPLIVELGQLSQCHKIPLILHEILLCEAI